MADSRSTRVADSFVPAVLGVLEQEVKSRIEAELPRIVRESMAKVSFQVGVIRDDMGILPVMRIEVALHESLLPKEQR